MIPRPILIDAGLALALGVILLVLTGLGVALIVAVCLGFLAAATWLLELVIAHRRRRRSRVRPPGSAVTPRDE